MVLKRVVGRVAGGGGGGGGSSSSLGGGKGGLPDEVCFFPVVELREWAG